MLCYHPTMVQCKLIQDWAILRGFLSFCFFSRKTKKVLQHLHFAIAYFKHLTLHSFLTTLKSFLQRIILLVVKVHDFVMLTIPFLLFPPYLPAFYGQKFNLVFLSHEFVLQIHNYYCTQ